KIINKYRKNILDYKYINPNELNRDNWVIKKLQSIPSGENILDAGAGEMRYKPYCSHLDYKSQDYCQYKGLTEGNLTEGLLNDKWDTSKIDIESDIISIPVGDNSFDNILCTEVFEHIPFPIKAIEEFKRIIKPGGKLILTAPFACLSHQTPYFFYSGYSVYWYKKFLEENNFEILEMSPNGNYFEYMLQEINRLEYCKNSYCKDLSMHYPEKEITKICMYLEECSKKQTNSEDILCFGWHVLAQSKGN
ncbi:class I SAM-dependent methyltransferase, partial [bacterium]|nr:class I SAM-dependent methyltransferase [bacterium]